MPSRLMGCTVCGARWVEEESELPSLVCDWCQSTAVSLERNLKGEAERIVKTHGSRAGINDETVTYRP